jgi:hypothetical protein
VLAQAGRECHDVVVNRWSGNSAVVEPGATSAVTFRHHRKAPTAGTGFEEAAPFVNTAGLKAALNML